MFIKATPSQIPMLWNLIKFAVANANSFKGDELDKFLNSTLYSLLSSKSQCWIRYGDDKILQMITVTRIVSDEITGGKSLEIQTLYSFQSVDNSQWIENMSSIKEFAKNIGCEKILAYSNSERVFEIAKVLGFAERFRCFVVDLKE